MSRRWTYLAGVLALTAALTVVPSGPSTGADVLGTSGLPSYVPADVSGSFDVGTGMFNLTEQNTARTRAALEAAATVPMNQVVVGDSLSAGWNTVTSTSGSIDRDKAWPYVFGRAFNSRVGLPAPGTGLVRAFEHTSLSKSYYDARWAPGPNGIGIKSHGHYLTVTNTTVSFDSGKSGFTPVVGTAAGVVYLDTDDFKVSVDGGAPVSVTGTGTGLVKRVELHGLPATTHVVKIQVAADQHIELVGAEVFSDGGASTSDLAQGGSGTTSGGQDDWSVPGTPDVSMSATFSSPTAYSTTPSTVYVMLGANDLDLNPNDLSKIRDGILETADFYRGSDIVLISEPELSADFSTVDPRPLMGMLYQLAEQNDWPLWDLQWFMGGYDVNALRSMNGDAVGHMTVGGYAWIGTTLAEIMSEHLTDHRVRAASAATVAGETLSAPAIAFGAWPVGESSPAVTISVTNTSNGRVQVVPTYGSSEFRSAASRAGDCVQDVAGTPQYLVLDIGQSCFLRPVFAPTKAASNSTSVALAERPTSATPGTLASPSASAALVTSSLALTGSAAVPKFTLSPTTLGFGHVAMFASKSMSTVVKNASTMSLQFDVAALGAGSPFATPAASGGCITATGSTSVVPGGSCTLQVDFLPRAAGQLTASLVVQAHRSSGEGTGPVTNPVAAKATVALSGTGDRPTFSASPTTPGFGNVTVGATKVMTVKVSNTSKASLLFTPSFPDPSTYRLAPFSASSEGTDCVPSSGPRVVAAGGSCSVRLLFSPQSAGSKPGTITVAVRQLVGASQEPVGSLTIKPTGSGVLPTYTLSPTSLAFGTVKVGASKVMSTKVSNTSAVPLLFSPSVPAGSGFTVLADGAAGDCRSSTGTVVVAAGASCTVRILFAPTSTGAKKATVTVAASADQGSQPALPIGSKTLALTGAGG